MKKSSRNKKAPAPPASVSSSDKVKVLVILPLLFAGLAVLFHFMCVSQQTRQIKKTVNGWGTTYHLNEEQLQRVIQIELDFHGNGSPFSMKEDPPADKRYHHHEKISQLMSLEDGARFMQVMEQNGANH